jgi:hypothetical protein
MTHSLKISQELNATESWQPLLTQSEKVDLVLNLINHSKQTQSEPPWIMWHRPLSGLTFLTQDWTMKENLHLFYNAS